MERRETDPGRRKKKKKRINIPFIIFLLVFLAALTVGIVYKIKQNNNSKVYDDLKDKVVKITDTPTPEPTRAPEDTPTPVPTEEPDPTPVPVEIPIDFDILHEMNGDIYAWIEIPGTVVAYPVLQSTTDPEDYYLDHTVERNSGLPGSLYTQMLNEKDFSDNITIIYGHNMANGTMFGTFNLYRDINFCNEHDQVIVYTPEHIYTYTIFACITYDNRLIPYAFDVKSEEGAQAYIDSLKAVRNFASYWRDGFEVSGEDNILTMSTCNGNADQRFLVEAVLTDVQ